MLLGLAVGSKWFAAWFIVGFAFLVIAWEIDARRIAGLRSFVRGALREAVWLPLTFLAIPLVVYVATWSNWLLTRTGYDRNYASLHGVNIPVISALYSLFEYHRQMIGGGLGLSTPSLYQSQPWDWLALTRPVAFYYESYRGPVAGPQYYCPSPACTGPSWSQEVLALGTPLIWWSSILALVFCLGWWL
jgi:dolichyl-phosphate-mannose-protein mannosyltransferase